MGKWARTIKLREYENKFVNETVRSISDVFVRTLRGPFSIRRGLVVTSVGVSSQGVTVIITLRPDYSIPSFGPYPVW